MQRHFLPLALLFAGAVSLAGVVSAESPRPFALQGETLEQGLPLLGHEYGAKLRSGWRIAHRRVFLYPAGRSLDETLGRLQAFLPQPPGKILLYQDGEARVLDEDSASYAARDKAARARQAFVRKRFSEGIARVAAFAAEGASPDDGYNGLRNECREVHTIFSGIPPKAQEEALLGRRTVVPFSDLSAPAQGAVQRTLFHLSAGNGALAFEGARDYPKSVIQIEQIGPPDHPGLRLHVTGEARFGNRVLPMPGFGRAFEDFANLPRVGKKGLTWNEESRKYAERRRRPDELEKHPDLQRKVRLPSAPAGPRWGTSDEVLADLSQQTALPLLGEYDPVYDTPQRSWAGGRRRLGATLTDVPLWKALDRVAATFDLEWDYRKGWPEIRSPRTLLSWSKEVDLSPPSAEERQWLEEAEKAVRDGAQTPPE